MPLEMILQATEIVFGVPRWIVIAFMAVLGAMIGSFLNVVIHRVPREQSFVLPKSACPACGAAIHFYDNIPILSFLILRGRCRSCRAPISPRYPAVEAVCALLFALVTWRDGLSFALPFDIAFAAAMLALVFIDSEHMILPNAITYPGILFALIARVAVPYLGGAWAVGPGRLQFVVIVGAFLGWRLAALSIFIGVFSGSLAGIALMLRRGQRNLQMMLPFGIFLGIGAVVSLIAGTRIIEWYVSQFK